jgi:hypothetical protein
MQDLNDLQEISANIRARVDDRIANIPGETEQQHWLAVLTEELHLANQEADEATQAAPETFRAGYNQGWADAVRVFLNAQFNGRSKAAIM